MRPTSSLIVGLATALCLAGCGGKVATDDVGGDPASAGPVSGSASSSGGSGSSGGSTHPPAPPSTPVCNTLVQQAPQITETIVRGQPDEAIGGIPADGIYTLTEDVLYASEPGVGPPVDRTTLEIQGSTMNVVETTSSGDLRSTFRMAVDGVVLRRVGTCGPLGNTDAWRFTATDTQLVRYEGGRNVLRTAQIFTRQ